MLDNKLLKLRQHKYEKKLSNDNFAIAAGAAFVRSIQSIGYKNSASAMGDIIDNSLEANASKIAIYIEGEGQKRDPNNIIIMDNGIGMHPLLMRKAATWGGTDREGSSEGLGRFGFGLPSASMSQGDKFQVISKQEGQKTFMVEFDLRKAEQGLYNDSNGMMQMPAAKEYELSKSMKKMQTKFLGDSESGTIVVLYPTKEQLSHKSVKGLTDHFRRELGTIFYNFLNDRSLYVTNSEEGVRAAKDCLVQPIDPSFRDPNGMHFDIEGSTSSPDPVGVIKDVLNPKTLAKGDIRIYMNYLGPKFFRKTNGEKGLNPRHSISKDSNGYVMMRNGRIIDCISHIQKQHWTNMPKTGVITTFGSNDAWLKVMIDFDASLDDLFGVETTKQRAMPNSDMWTKIFDSKLLFPQFTEFRKIAKKESELMKEAQAKIETAVDGLTPGERALQEASIFSNPDPVVKEFQDKKGDAALEKHAIDLLEERQDIVTPEAIEEEKGKLKTNRRQKIKLVSIEGANFVTFRLFGPTLFIEINTEHEFFKKMYAHESTSTYMKEALKVFLGSIGDRYFISEDNIAFYNRELRNISDLLAIGLVALEKETMPAGTESLDVDVNGETGVSDAELDEMINASFTVKSS